ALTRNLATLGMRIRGVLGHRVMPDWRAPQAVFAMNWPVLQPYRFYTKRELETYCREAGLVPVTNAHRLGKKAFSHADFMGIRQYAGEKAKHWLKSSVPAFREFILLTLAQPTGEELRLGAVTNGSNHAAADGEDLAEHPFVSVVVPTKDRAEMLGDCFAGLMQQTYPADCFEVVLVNDGSTDDTEEVVKGQLIPAAPFAVNYVKTTGIGATAARNLGMEEARGEIVAHLDDDCRPVPEWMEEGVRGFSDESVAIVGGPVFPKTEQAANFFSITASYTDDRGAYPTANIFLRRDVAISTGGFDLSFGGNLLGRPVSGWDADLVWRMRRQGYRPKFRRGAQVYMEIFQQEPLEWVLHSWRMITLPKMVKRIPEIDRYLLLNRFFAHESTFLFDLALAGGVLAAAKRNPLPLLPVALWAAWWAPKVAPNDLRRPHRWPKLVAKLGLIGARQAVCLGALVVGSAGAKRVVI
ncbi:MAG TPA: glycosyltransferase family A protein, partial [Dehalococcoidia bacterium]